MCGNNQQKIKQNTLVNAQYKETVGQIKQYGNYPKLLSKKRKNQIIQFTLSATLI